MARSDRQLCLQILYLKKEIWNGECDLGNCPLFITETSGLAEIYRRTCAESKKQRAQGRSLKGQNLRIGLGKGPRVNPLVGKISWRRECQSTPVFLPGEFHGERSLVGNSSWGRKESDPMRDLTPGILRMGEGSLHNSLVRGSISAERCMCPGQKGVEVIWVSYVIVYYQNV